MHTCRFYFKDGRERRLTVQKIDLVHMVPDYGPTDDECLRLRLPFPKRNIFGLLPYTVRRFECKRWVKTIPARGEREREVATWFAYHEV